MDKTRTIFSSARERFAKYPKALAGCPLEVIERYKGETFDLMKVLLGNHISSNVIIALWHARVLNHF